MFTFKPATKNGANGNGNGNGNGHTNGNGSANGNGHGNSSDNSNGNGHAAGNGNGNGHAAQTANSNGHTSLGGWLGLGNGQKNGSAPKIGNGHANGNGHSNKIESVLGPGIHFQGNFSGAGGLRIEGTFDGTITVKGPVVVADGAKVTADIQALSVSVAGSVQGNITANKVEIRSTGRIFGDLITTAFSTEEGAFLRGQVRMEDDITAPAPAQLTAPATLPEATVVATEAPVEVAV